MSANNKMWVWRTISDFHVLIVIYKMISKFSVEFNTIAYTFPKPLIRLAPGTNILQEEKFKSMHFRSDRKGKKIPERRTHPPRRKCIFISI
jgi:hypothetical protein